MSCLTYYKLVSNYECDYTANCKLNINQIDQNFYQLKSDDIKSAELDEETKSVILTRNDGEKFVVDLTPILSGAVYDLEIVYDNPSDEKEGSSSGATVNVSYKILGDDDEKHLINVPISGLVTTNNIDTIYGEGLLTKVYSDGTLSGNGTLKSPLSVSKLWLNTPAIRVIDRIEGEELPLEPAIGDKYVTKEIVSDYGRLYNYKAIESISNKLSDDGSFWRVPSKEDWDCLLNSFEPCECVDDGTCSHSLPDCHIELGKTAGKKLKSKCAWLDIESGEIIECECVDTRPFAGHFCDDEESGSTSGDTSDEEEPIVYGECYGVDEIGMRVLPSGYKRDCDDEIKQIGKSTVFWTNSHVYGDIKQDIYVKKFDYDKCGVVQEAQCPDDFYSLRLVKDYTGENYLESEVIDGITYKTVLVPECKQVWISTNFVNEYEDSIIAGDESLDRIVYFVNVWNGKLWEKRPLNEGETIVVMEGNEHCQYNIEYRVYLESGEHSCNNQALINSDEAIAERVEYKIYEKYIVPISGAIDTLSGAIDTEREERISGDTALWEALSAETEERKEADELLWEALSAETEARIEADEDLQRQIDEEVERATEREDEIDGQLIDWSKNPFVLSAATEGEYNIVLDSKDGNEEHFIKIKFDGNFGKI